MTQSIINKYREFLTNFLVFGLSAFGSKIILFLLVPLYTNTMTAEQYGVADLVTTVSSFVIPLASLSIHDALFRFAFDDKIDKRELLKCFYAVSTIASIFIIITGVLLNFAGFLYGHVYLFILICIASLVRDPYALYVKARGKTKMFALDAVLYVCYLAFANWVLLVILKTGTEGYLLSILIAKLCSLAFLFFFSAEPTFILPVGINRSLLHDMLSYSAPLILNSVSWWVMSYANRYALNLLIGAASVGIFAVASKIPSLLSTFVDIFSQSWTILAVKEFEENRDSSVFGTVFSVFSCLVLIFGSFVILIVEPFMGIYVGADFIDAIIVVPFLLAGAVFLAYSSFFGIIFNSAKQTSPLMSSSLIGAIVNVVLVAILLPALGVIGASVATAAGYFATFLYRLASSRKYISFQLDGARLSLSLLIIIAQCTLSTFYSTSKHLSLLCFALLVIIHCKTLQKFSLRSLKNLLKGAAHD